MKQVVHHISNDIALDASKGASPGSSEPMGGQAPASHCANIASIDVIGGIAGSSGHFHDVLFVWFSVVWLNLVTGQRN